VVEKKWWGGGDSEDLDGKPANIAVGSRYSHPGGQTGVGLRYGMRDAVWRQTGNGSGTRPL